MAKQRGGGPRPRRSSGGGDAEAKFQQAVKAFQKGDFRQAQKIVQRLEKTFGAVPQIAHLRGFIELELGNLAPAIRALSVARDAMPDDVNVINALGAAYRRLGDGSAALEQFNRAAAMAPMRADILANLGNALSDQGDRATAVEVYDKALALDPTMGEVRRALISDLMALGQHDRARRELESMVETATDDDGWALLALAREQATAFDYDGARQSFGRLLDRDPGDWDARLAMAAMSVTSGRVAEGVAAFAQAKDALPKAPYPAAAWALNLNYLPETKPGDLLAAGRAWNQALALPTVKQRRCPYKEGEALRVGILSGKLGWHPCGQFLAPYMKYADPDRVQIELFAQNVTEHPLTGELRNRAAHWHDVSKRSPQQTLDLLVARELDVLISPTGLEESELLQLFTARPAPIQVLAFAHFATTGLDAMDAIVADRFHIPDGAEGAYAETVLRLPNGYLSYMPPPYLPALSGRPADHGGPLTFGCFNALPKLCDRTLALWGRVMAAAPGSRLILKAGPFADAEVRRDFTQRFAAMGVDADRLDLRPGSPHPELLATYNEIDLALDPVAYSGGLTTLEALWMGVPVVTLPGETFARRHSLSHLSLCGLGAFVAADEDDYVRIASTHPAIMAEAGLSRAGVRAAIQGSPISDGRGYAEALTQGLEQLWKDAAARG